MRPAQGVTLGVDERSFNSRTLGRVRHISEVVTTALTEFQFTHPGKGATSLLTTSLAVLKFQFTHPGKGATSFQPLPIACVSVSIHAPWEGCDTIFHTSTITLQCFNSRTLGRVRQPLTQHLGEDGVVSIHAPWEGCDEVALYLSRITLVVSIHAPWEGCDYIRDNNTKTGAVSIHAPWEGCDSVVQSCVL